MISSLEIYNVAKEEGFYFYYSLLLITHTFYVKSRFLYCEINYNHSHA